MCRSDPRLPGPAAAMCLSFPREPLFPLAPQSHWEGGASDTRDGKGSMNGHHNAPGRSWGCPVQLGWPEPTALRVPLREPRAGGCPGCHSSPSCTRRGGDMLPGTQLHPCLQGAESTDHSGSPLYQRSRMRKTLPEQTERQCYTPRQGDTHACSCWGSGWACQKSGKTTKLLAHKAQR